MQKKWVEHPKADQVKIMRLAKALDLPKTLLSLLIKRQKYSFEDVKLFFQPKLSDLHDPFLMKDMERAIARIEKALKKNEKILIYGDYDVDGTTAVAIVYNYFKVFYSSIEFYIPNRYTEGYGISQQSIDWAYEHSYSLIIALDCGIKDANEVAYAKKRGIDFIIGDHHTPGEVLPRAHAILNPKQANCSYPYKELSGCGIAFKLIHAFAKSNNQRNDIFKYLDLVAVSIISDIVPITDENRILTYYGLKKLNSSPCFGLQALMNIAGRKGEYGVDDVLFQIGPRINAAGRMSHARDAVKLLIAQSLEEAELYSSEVNLQNIERKEHDSRITEQALEIIKETTKWKNRRTTVVYRENWNKGVIGIVASRLIETYYRPTIVLTSSNGMVSGSARSVAGYNLYEALDACSDLLERFGGHKYAAGLTLREENVVALQDRFEEVVAASIHPKLLVPEINIDEELSLNEINARFYRVLKRFAPFGPMNHAPIFISKGVSCFGPASIVGKSHLKFSVIQGNSPLFHCIGFGLGDLYTLISSGHPFDICYSIEENNWRNQASIQLNIKGIRRIEA